MRSATKLLLLAAALAVTVGLAACGGDGSTEATSNREVPAAEAGSTMAGDGAMKHEDSTRIVVAAGEPVGGVAELEFSAGDEIRFTVESDAAEEIHVHGYDVSKQVPAGGSVSFSFSAEIEGIFEVEMEELGVRIAELRINP